MNNSFKNSMIIVASLMAFGQSITVHAAAASLWSFATKTTPRKIALGGAATGAALLAAHRAYQEWCYSQERSKQKTILDEQETKENGEKIQFLLAHGLGADASNVTGAYCPSLFPRKITTAFNFPEVHGGGCHLGQEGDIKCCAQEYLKIKTPKIYFGVSRGASVGINLMGRYQLRQLKAAILESPFADLKDIIPHFAGDVSHKIAGPVAGSVVATFSSLPGVANTAELIISKVPVLNNYSPYGIRPIDVAHKIQHDIPVLLVCSKEDGLIPYWSTVRLYREMVKVGHTMTHLLVLDHGPHANILFDRNGEIYRNVVHAFLRHYKKQIGAYTNEYYNEAWADAGVKQFMQTQPLPSAL